MKKKKRNTGWIWILVLLLGAGAFYYYYWMPKQQAALTGQKNYSEYTVAKSSVSVTVTGSGLLEAGDEVDETVTGELKITGTCVKEGDRVAEGDILYTLDPDTVEKRILAVSQQVADSRRTLSRYSDSDAIYAPGAGRLKILYAQKGDLCREVLLREGCLAVLSADELMGVRIVTDKTVTPGEELRVTYTYEGRPYNDKGSVESLTEDGFIAVFPDGNALPGEPVTVNYNGAELGKGEAYIHMPLYVINTEGAIKNVDARLNASLNIGSKIFTLAEGAPSDAYRQTVRDREEASDELLELLRYREDPVIRAGHAGTVALLPLSENDTTVKDVSVVTLHTGGAVKMTVDIDETDIPGIRLGQPAEVTLDAYPDTPFAASVTRLPLIGVQSGTITVYKAELTLEPDDRLLEGMHGSAVITLESHENVVTVPVAVLEEDESGTYALVPGAEVPQKRYVKTGISNGTLTEITEGLSEGDVLLYIPRGGTDMVTKMMVRSERMMANYGG